MQTKGIYFVSEILKFIFSTVKTAVTRKFAFSHSVQTVSSVVMNVLFKKQ
jgi:hypothetical protein